MAPIDLPAWRGIRESKRTNVHGAIIAQARNGTAVSPLSPVSPVYFYQDRPPERKEGVGGRRLLADNGGKATKMGCVGEQKIQIRFGTRDLMVQ